MKHISILCLGTRGDVQPYIALALGLQQRGWVPTIAAPVNLQRLVEHHGIRCHPVALDTEKGLKSPEGIAWLRSGNTRAFLRCVQQLLHKERALLERGLLEASEGADALIGTVMTLGETLSLSEKLGIPFAGSLTFPLLPRTGEFANVFVRPKALPLAVLNRASHWAFEREAWAAGQADLNNWRSRLGLPALRQSVYRKLEEDRVLMLHNYSSILVPRPGDWKEHHVLTGPLYLSDAGDPASPKPALDARLQRFLGAGSKPVYFGFGSMPLTDAGQILRMTGNIAEQLDIRAVVATGWSEYRTGELSPRLHLIESADHDLLFPHCRAVVHHGGAGTTAAGARWGKPAVVFSVFADQPFWGERLVQAGAGVHFPVSSFNEARLASGLRQVLTPATQQRAQALGERLRAETGLRRSVEAIDAGLGGRADQPKAFRKAAP